MPYDDKLTGTVCTPYVNASYIVLRKIIIERYLKLPYKGVSCRKRPKIIKMKTKGKGTLVNARRIALEVILLN
jgi:hypothetical protein